MAEDGSVQKTIVFLIVFSALFSFMYAYSSAAFADGSDPQQDDFLVRHFSPEELGTMTFWENDLEGDGNDTYGGYVYNIDESITWGTEVIEPSWNSEPECDGTRLDFYGPDDQHVRVYPIGDDWSYDGVDDMAKTKESFLAYQQWGWWDREWESITFESIVRNIKVTDEGVKSNIHIDLRGGMNVYFLFPLGTTAENARAILTAGYGFQIAIAQSFMDATESGNNAWNALTGLLTFSIDTGFWMLDYLISVPVYASIAFIAFYIVKELIP